MDMQWNWNNMQNANTQTAADAGQRAALENELRQNDARIAELKAQLQQNRVNADELDRKLAANRAGIGDTSTALAHQRAIDDRAQRAAMNAYAEVTRRTERESLREGQKKKLIEEIENTDIDLSFADVKTKRALLAKRRRLVEELESLGGSYAAYEETSTPEELEKFKIQHTDKNGYWDSEENKEFYESQSRALGTAEGEDNAKGTKSTQAEADEKRTAWIRRKESARSKAADLQKGMMNNYELKADFATRWNSPNPDEEIKELKVFFTWDAVQGFKDKGGK